jgi:hypothetical protein
MSCFFLAHASVEILMAVVDEAGAKPMSIFVGLLAHITRM